MSNNNYVVQNQCPYLAVVISIIIGITTAFLTFGATITITPAFLWVVFGIAVVYLLVTFVTFYVKDSQSSFRCIFRTVPALLIGILGTILTAIILLGVAFAATSVLGAIISGLLLFFFTLMITATACLVRCATCTDND